MTYSQAGQLPHHQYCWVDASFLGSGTGFLPCVWFGLVSIPGRMWGCTIMLECGAVYRAVPPHAIAFDPQPKEFMFIRTDGERLTIQPTDKVIFIEKSWTETSWPQGLRTTDKVYTCE